MRTETKAYIFKATLLPTNELEIVAKTKGKKTRTYKVHAPVTDFLREGELPESLKGKEIVFEVDADGALNVIPFFAVSGDTPVMQGADSPVVAPQGQEPSSAPKLDPRKRVKKWKKPLVTLSTHEDSHDGTIRVSDRKGTGNGILCPDCDKHELVDGDDSTIRLSDRPTIAINCVCGYSGRRSL